jgi:CheY-like chemotaxis protein
VLLVDLEPALAGLLAEWLRQAGIEVCAARGAQASRLPCQAELLVTDIPFPRHGPSPRLQALALAWPGMPVLALSPTFFAGVAVGGEVARHLGVAAVLATPVTRDAWLATVQRLLVRPP